VLYQLSYLGLRSLWSGADFTRREEDCQAEGKIGFTGILHASHTPLTYKFYNPGIKRRNKMIRFSPVFKKIALAVLILGIGLAVLPAASASAAGSFDERNQPNGERVSSERLEHAWARLQKVFAGQEERLGKAGDFIARIQGLIDKANAKGLDTSAVQAALDAFAANIPAAQAAHEPGAAIIASHDGFDDSGQVTDRAAALETARALGQVIKNTHSAMGGTGEALRDAIRAFREATRPIRTDVPTP
jgi:hypothetical protein